MKKKRSDSHDTGASTSASESLRGSEKKRWYAARTRTCTTRVICTYLLHLYHVSLPLLAPQAKVDAPNSEGPNGLAGLRLPEPEPEWQ